MHSFSHDQRFNSKIASIPVSYLFALILVVLFPVATLQAQISPGPLSKAHKKWDGPAGCVSCHQVGAGSAQFRCLECHKDIASRLSGRRGYHASILPSNATGKDCVRCHSEHNGATFQIVRWEPKSFDHTKTGFALNGKHASLECTKCHTSSNIPAAEKANLTATDLNKTFLGLSNACISCHEDKHRGRLGSECQRCHSTSDWKVTSKFDHSKTRFPLSGAHVDVTCQKCHTMPDKTVKYSGLSFETCNSCHADPHRGFFKQTCQSCHSTAAWKTAATAAKFDHSKTPYPLIGKHAEVKCESCHEHNDFAKVISFRQCADCHRDPHNGQFAKRADGGKCESCHTVAGFQKVAFSVADHSRTAYPLLGKHTNVECAKCHIPAGAKTVYKLKFASCTDCHRDYHDKQFAHAPYLGKCEACHTVEGFQPSTFTLALHQKLEFRLTGGHAAVACGDCHKSPAPGVTAAFHFQGLACTTCHADPHRGQFAQRMAARGKGCETCHNTDAWADVTAFDHASTKFALTGTHRAVRCAECHRPPNLELSLKNVNFSAAPQQCEDCHQDPHAAQFAGADKVTRCAECHNTMKWRPSLFDHEKTIFPLQGAHKDVPCAQCHKQIQLVEGKKVIFYKPTPRTCVACHGAKITDSPAKS
ncbi:MAG TPA: hypothetical protein VF135_02555 [Terriglobales bacterium]